MLSVVIPAIDADVELRRCVDSVKLACQDTPCEILIVMPLTKLVAARRLLGDVLLVPETRRGIYAAMNDGVAASTGRYLYFIGKDDIMLPTFREVIHGLATASPSAVFCDVYWGALGVYSGKPSRWRVLLKNFCHQGIVYSRAVIERHGPYMRKMRVQADHYLNIKLLWDPRFGPAVTYVRGPHVWYSGDGFSNAARDPVFWRLYPAIMRRHVGTFAAFLLVLSRKMRGR